MHSGRLWAAPGAPDEAWVKPHILWLPQSEPHVLGYFARLHEVVARYPDVIAPIAPEDLHMTIQSIKPLNKAGVLVDSTQLEKAAASVQSELADLEPFRIDIGPARASGSAGIVEIWPEEGPAMLNRRVRRGLLAAGMDLPPEEEHFWSHMSCGYGVQDTDTPELAARSDQLASDLGKAIRPGIRTSAVVSSVWLVWERQCPGLNTYTFQPVHELRLGSS